MAKKKINIGIIGTGGMAGYHAGFLSSQSGVRIMASCDVREDVVNAFKEKYNIDKAYTDYHELLENKKIDAVINVTPDRFHKDISIEALQAGKHVLCEKPLAENYVDAKEMADVAKQCGKINMVHLTYRNSFAIQKAKEIIDSGKIGEVMHVDASYLQSWLNNYSWGGWHENPAWLWRMSTAHGSKGVLGDIGVHILDFASFPVGGIKKINAQLKTFPKGNDGKWKEYTLDANDTAMIHAEFENGALGTISTTRWASGHANSVKISIYGTLGGIEIDLNQSYSALKLCKGKKSLIEHSWKKIECKKTPTILERFLKSVRTGKQDQPDFARGAEVQKMLDACFESSENDKTIEL